MVSLNSFFLESHSYLFWNWFEMFLNSFSSQKVIYWRKFRQLRWRKRKKWKLVKTQHPGLLFLTFLGIRKFILTFGKQNNAFLKNVSQVFEVGEPVCSPFRFLWTLRTFNRALQRVLLVRTATGRSESLGQGRRTLTFCFLKRLTFTVFYI